MGSGSKTRGWAGSSRRRAPRFRTQAPLDVTVLRSGIPDTVPGRALNVCERGMAAVLAGDLVLGESVGVELRLSTSKEPLRTRAIVRYQDKLQCGLEFVALTSDQLTGIREWAREAKVGPKANERVVSLFARAQKKEAQSDAQGKNVPGAQETGGLAKVLLITGVLIAIPMGVFWWKWNRSWQEIEVGMKNPQSAPAGQPQAQVPAEVMQKLLLHRVEPVYPAAARKQHLQGIIALDIIVGRDGSVASMRALNGPEVLANAAMDALRWWKFEPYRLNGEPAVVETTVAVEFK